MKRKTEREKFEAWAEDCSIYLFMGAHEVRRDEYSDCDTQAAWLAWQAAKRQAARERRRVRK